MPQTSIQHGLIQRLSRLVLHWHFFLRSRIHRSPATSGVPFCTCLERCLLWFQETGDPDERTEDCRTCGEHKDLWGLVRNELSRMPWLNQFGPHSIFLIATDHFYLCREIQSTPSRYPSFEHISKIFPRTIAGSGVIFA